MTESMSVLKKHSRDGSVNRGVRDIEKSRMNTHLQDLQKANTLNSYLTKYKLVSNQINSNCRRLYLA